MNKKVIVLADNSYTIRRIVELSFSEIENTEVHSFDSGAGFKEKLLQLSPAVVIVDIKLPEMNGYEVCRFVNETAALRRSRVFLMKGSFEPVDNEVLKDLKYEDIITKPFDSNALVAAVMRIIDSGEQDLVAGFGVQGPSTFPEDLAEIETGAVKGEDISFSDVRSEMEVPPVFARSSAPVPTAEHEEIQPSEEITQGTQPLKDNLMPQEAEEPIENPFDDEPAFEEIHAASAAAPSAPLEYEEVPLPDRTGAGEAKDVSDEFHERFLEMANEDTSEEIARTPLEASSLANGEESEFPVGLQGEQPQAREEKLFLEFERADMDEAAQTAHAGPAAPDFAAPETKEHASGELEFAPDKMTDIVVEKAEPAEFSPQDELAQLIGEPQNDVKAEPPTTATSGENFELTGKLEEKLSQTIKELLWEIVPPLAEKLIKEEIDKIKSDLNDSGL